MTLHDPAAPDGCQSCPQLGQSENLRESAVMAPPSSAARVVFKGRTADVFGVAHLELSDGTTTTKVAIPSYVSGGALWRVCDFATLTGITSMRIVSDSAAGTNPGFIEVEAYLLS